jgi:hypothetical protein
LAHPAAYPMCTGGYNPGSGGVKEQGHETGHSLSCRVAVSSGGAMVPLLIQLRALVLNCIAKHTDNCTVAGACHMLGLHEKAKCVTGVKE